MKKIGVYAGSFDPFTVGHANIVKRALGLVDELHIVIGANILKEPFLRLEQRLEAIKSLYRDEERVKVITYHGIIAEYAIEHSAILIRGIRNASDLAAEQVLADVNREHFGVETVCLFSEPRYSFISSSMIRELSAFGKDYSEYIPKNGVE